MKNTNKIAQSSYPYQSEMKEDMFGSFMHQQCSFFFSFVDLCWSVWLSHPKSSLCMTLV